MYRLTSSDSAHDLFLLDAACQSLRRRAIDDQEFARNDLLPIHIRERVLRLVLLARWERLSQMGVNAFNDVPMYDGVGHLGDLNVERVFGITGYIFVDLESFFWSRGI